MSCCREAVFRSLSELERKVVQLRFGLLDGKEREIEEVARELRLPKESVRAAESRVFEAIHAAELALEESAKGGFLGPFVSGTVSSDLHRPPPRMSSALPGADVAVRSAKNALAACGDLRAVAKPPTTVRTIRGISAAWMRIAEL
jgi:hypothetical protein